MPSTGLWPSRRTALVGAALAALTFPARADYTDGAITLVVPFPPGGPNDVIGRLLAQKLADALGVQVVAENRPGAGGAAAIASVAREGADSHVTIVPSGVGYVTHPLLTSAPSYRVGDLRSAALITGGPAVVAIRPDLPVATLADLMALAKKEPGSLSYASSGVGTTTHLGVELFKYEAGVDIVHIPYKGTSEVLVDLMAGRVDLSFVSPLVVRKLIDQGKLRALATTGATRASGWEEVPTVAEAGLPNFEMTAWYPLMVPAATPDDVVEKLNAATVASVNAPDAAARLRALGFEPMGGSVADAEAYEKAEAEKWAKVIADARLKAD